VGGNIGKCSKNPLKAFDFCMTELNSSWAQMSGNVVAVLGDKFTLLTWRAISSADFSLLLSKRKLRSPNQKT